MEPTSETETASRGEESAGSQAPLTDVTDDAVGVPQWFVAIVNHNAEKTVAQRLTDLGYETYVASQPMLRISPSGRRRKLDKVIISSHVFVRCTETQRRKIVGLPYVNRFLADRARAKDGLAAPAAIIPQRELEILRFMLGQSDHPVTLTQTHYRPGDKVRVIRGALRGLEGEVLSPLGTNGSNPKARPDDSAEPATQIFVSLAILGTARVTLTPADLIPAP